MLALTAAGSCARPMTNKLAHPPCILRCLSALAPPPSVSTLEHALRHALPSCTTLPAALCDDLLAEEECAVDVELLGSSLALPSRPYVRELATALLLWRRCGTFPWPDVPRAPDLLEVPASRAAAFAPCTPAVLWLTLRPDVPHATSLLDDLGPAGVLALLRMRRSVGTALRAPPSPHTLCASFVSRHAATSGLTVGARALSKHAHRSASDFWGARRTRGNDGAKNAHAVACLRSMFASACWVNVHQGVGDEMGGVYEIRQVDGYGMRWSADGLRFRGFVEPQAWDVERRRREQLSSGTRSVAADVSATAAAADLDALSAQTNARSSPSPPPPATAAAGDADGRDEPSV